MHETENVLFVPIEQCNETLCSKISFLFFFVNKKSLQAQHDIKYVSVLVLNLRMSFFTATYSKHVSRFRRRDTNLRGCIKSVGNVYPSCSVYTHDQLNNIYDGLLSTTRAQYRFYLVIKKKKKKRLNKINKEIFLLAFIIILKHFLIIIKK